MNERLETKIEIISQQMFKVFILPILSAKKLINIFPKIANE